MGATYFVDLDGTILKHGTNQLLPGAQALLDAIIAKGGDIVFTTYRGDENFKNHKVYSREGAMEGIRALKTPYKTVIFDSESPRIVINDGGSIAISHKTNAAWSESDVMWAVGQGEGVEL